MEYKVLKTSEENSIATVVINRPEAMNALNSTFFAEMKQYVLSLQKRDDVKVLIITGEGKSFAAGADIAEMVGLNSEQGKQWSKDGQEVFNLIEELEIPVIGAINGFALGGGCELAMSCDFRIASSKAKFGQPEVNLGLVPGYAGTQRLSRLTGLADALFLICSAEMITADEALRIGLVQKVVEPEQLMIYVTELAKKITTKGPISVKKGKMLIRKGIGMGIKEASEMESEVFGSLFGTPEALEGMKAFLEKRPASFN